MITVRGTILIIALLVLAAIIIIALFVIVATVFKDWFKVPMNTPAKRDYVFDSIYTLGYHYLKEKVKLTQVQMGLRLMHDIHRSKMRRRKFWEKYKISGIRVLDNRLVKIMKELDASDLNKGIVLGLFAKYLRDSKYFSIIIPRHTEYEDKLNSYIDLLVFQLFHTQTLLDNPDLSIADLVLLKEEFKIDEVPVIIAAIKQYVESRL